MDSGVTLPFDILAMIFAHLSPPEVARMRVLNKDICARISAGPYAQKFWHYPRYEIFVEVVTSFYPDSYRQSLAKGYWTIDQLQQVQRICRGVLYLHTTLTEEGFINNPELKSFPFCTNMVFALVEKLCTVDMITRANPEIMEVIFSSNDVMLELLREGRLDVLKYFSQIQVEAFDYEALSQNVYNMFNCKHESFNLKEFLIYVVENNYSYNETIKQHDQYLWTKKLCHMCEQPCGFKIKRSRNLFCSEECLKKFISN